MDNEFKGENIKNDSLLVKFYGLKDLDYSTLKRVVIVCKHDNKWVFCKAKTRDTWEIPGGKIEVGETPIEAAARELFEETGAKEYTIKPLCLFFVSQPALLCFADVYEFDSDLKFEIEKIDFFDDIPLELTYPEIHPFLFEEAKKYIKNN